MEKVKNFFKNVPLIALIISIIGNGIQGYQTYSNKKQHEDKIKNYQEQLAPEIDCYYNYFYYQPGLSG